MENNERQIEEEAQRSSRLIWRQGATYLVVGVLSAAIDLGTFQLLYAIFGVDIAIANPIALSVSTIFNFVANRSITFKSTSNPIRSMVLYAVLLVANMAITTLAIMAMVNVGIHSALAKVIMQACAATWNFFLYRAFIFK